MGDLGGLDHDRPGGLYGARFVAGRRELEQGDSNQALAGNAWAYFQAKSIKEHSFELQKDLLLAQLTHVPNIAKPHYDERVQKCTKEVWRDKKEKNEIEKDAKSYETVRDDALKRKDQFANSTTILQVAIMIASVGLVIKRAAMWGLSLLLGVLGIAFYTNGYLSFSEPWAACQRVAPRVNRPARSRSVRWRDHCAGVRPTPATCARREGIGQLRCVGEAGGRRLFQATEHHGAPDPRVLQAATPARVGLDGGPAPP